MWLQLLLETAFYSGARFKVYLASDGNIVVEIRYVMSQHLPPAQRIRSLFSVGTGLIIALTATINSAYGAPIDVCKNLNVEALFSTDYSAACNGKSVCTTVDSITITANKGAEPLIAVCLKFS